MVVVMTMIVVVIVMMRTMMIMLVRMTATMMVTRAYLWLRVTLQTQCRWKDDEFKIEVTWSGSQDGFIISDHPWKPFGYFKGVPCYGCWDKEYKTNRAGVNDLIIKHTVVKTTWENSLPAQNNVMILEKQMVGQFIDNKTKICKKEVCPSYDNEAVQSNQEDDEGVDNGVIKYIVLQRSNQNLTGKIVCLW